MIRADIKLFFIAAILFISSCNNDSYHEYYSDSAIETGITFMPVENYEEPSHLRPQTPVLQLRLSTAVVYPCSNYGLVTTEFVQGRELIIRFDEVIEPVGCLTSLGPATSYIDLSEDIIYKT